MARRLIPVYDEYGNLIPQAKTRPKPLRPDEHGPRFLDTGTIQPPEPYQFAEEPFPVQFDPKGNNLPGLQETPSKTIHSDLVTDVARRSAPVRSMLNQTIEKVIQQRMPSAQKAVEAYFDELEREDGDKGVKEHFRKNFITPEGLKEMERSQAKMLAEHLDFQQYRVFKRGHEFQQMIMLAKTQRNYVMAGRRSGKTEGFTLLSAHEVIKPEHNVLIIGLTHETAIGLYWFGLLRFLEELDLPVAEKRQSDGVIRLANGSLIKLTGNTTADEREKLRGGKWHLVIIDEVQSQKALPYLVRDILEPMLIDYRGKLYLGGTGPRVRGTFWERVWMDDLGASRFNFNLTNNPFIPDHSTVLAKIREDKKLSEHDPLYLREYLGKIAYDDDALVLRFAERNFYTSADFTQWLYGVPRTDVRFVGGIDFGYTDSDAVAILCYVESRPEIFLVYQHKANRQGLEQLKAGIQAGLDFLRYDAMFQSIPDDSKKDFPFFVDSSDGRAANDLSIGMGIWVNQAWKHDKQSAWDMIQDDVRTGVFRIPRIEGGMSPIEDEGMKTVFLRDDNDNLTREIDDDSYHPDMIPAVIYACRSGPWMYQARGKT
jgi:hypothetical protein